MIKCRYNKKSIYMKLKKIKKFLTKKEKLFRRGIIFSGVPIDGFYKYKDIFQLLPPEDDFPKMSMTNHHPAILEICFNKPDKEYESISENCIKQPINDDIMEMHYGAVKSRNIQKLLTLFSNYQFFDYDKLYQAWFIAYEGNGFSQKSVWGQQSYRAPDFNKKIEKLSEYKSKNKPKEIEKQKDLNKYYNQLFAGSERPLKFPLNIDVLFNKYFSLSGKKIEAFDSACRLFYYGFDLLMEKQSLALASFISSLETLIEYEYKDQKPKFECDYCKSIIESSPLKCNFCGKPVWGVRAKFREFLSEYGNDSKEFEKVANSFYDLRSKILHMGQLLLADKDINYWADNNENMEESLRIRHFMQITRICLINWLLKSKTIKNNK